MKHKTRNRTYRALRSIAPGLLGIALLAAPLTATKAQTPLLKVNPETGESQAHFVKRTQWWREAKFGMFIHWGIYSVPADSSQGAGEWYFYNHTDHDPATNTDKHLQVSDYEKFAAQFNPVSFDAHKWVEIAKNAGMKYIVITTKHHDGFCMFDSKLTDYCITKATPYKRDPLKELAAECKKAGIRLCFYHSIMDWHHPDYLPRRSWDTRPTEGASLDKYIAYMKGQLTEILTHYGPIGGIWFDGGWEHKPEELHALEVVQLIRKLQPGILINDRIDLPEDYSTPEQTIPANALPGGRLWETCMTMNDTWGYARNDHDWKPADDLIHKLCDIASKGGNFLLNVGPTELGEIPAESVDRLGTVGQWMQINSASIYNTTKSPFHKLPFDGRCTQQGNKLYLQVFHWPAEGLKLTGLKTRVQSAIALQEQERLKVTQSAEGLSIPQPKKMDPYATVIELRLAGPAVVDSVAAASIRPQADGSVMLPASEAEIHGETAQYEQGNGHDNIGYWTNAADYVTWPIELPAAGKFSVELTYACPSDVAGSEFTLGLADGASLKGTVQGTASWAEYHEVTLGTLSLPAGKHALAVHIQKMPHFAAMNLQRITLRPLP